MEEEKSIKLRMKLLMEYVLSQESLEEFIDKNASIDGEWIRSLHSEDDWEGAKTSYIRKARESTLKSLEETAVSIGELYCKDLMDVRKDLEDASAFLRDNDMGPESWKDVNLGKIRLLKHLEKLFETALKFRQEQLNQAVHTDDADKADIELTDEQQETLDHVISKLLKSSL